MSRSAQPVRFRNRATGALETEPIYGERWLRFLYDHPLGALPIHLAARRAWFSRWYGRCMDHPRSAALVRPFIERYRIDMGDFLDDPDSFGSFGAFFERRLRPGARPIAESGAVFPADGRHLGFTRASDAHGHFVKGHPFDLTRLLGDPELARRHSGGALVLSRLCPTDYHRFHFPVAGLPGTAVPLPGPLFSVNPIALARRPSILFENRRVRLTIESESAGSVTLVLIGATFVGRIATTYRERMPVACGAEIGTFQFGGSAIATLFEPGRVELARDLVETTREGLELYARMGETMGSVLPARA